MWLISGKTSIETQAMVSFGLWPWSTLTLPLTHLGLCPYLWWWWLRRAKQCKDNVQSPMAKGPPALTVRTSKFRRLSSSIHTYSLLQLATWFSRKFPHTSAVQGSEPPGALASARVLRLPHCRGHRLQGRHHQLWFIVVILIIIIVAVVIPFIVINTRPCTALPGGGNR